MRTAVIIAALALAGCATSIKEMRTEAPNATYTSAKSADAITSCVATEISGHGHPTVINGGDENLVAFGSAGHTVLLVSIRPVAEGRTSVEVRQALSYFARNAVERCV